MKKKALLTWNIRAQTQGEHFHRLREFISKLPILGLELRDAWYTLYGEAPDILLGIVTREKQDEQLEAALTSKEWKEMLDELQQYIKDYHQRIVKEAQHFQF
jgi:hypothetical protein